LNTDTRIVIDFDHIDNDTKINTLDL
jgi:hypothetical protein